MDIQFGGYVAPMRYYGVYREIEFFGNLFVGESFYNQPDDLFFRELNVSDEFSDFGEEIVFFNLLAI